MARRNPRYGDTVRVGPYRILTAHLTLAALLLKSLGAQKRELQRMEMGVIGATPANDSTGMPKGNLPGDPTSAAALRLDDENEPSFAARQHLRMQIRTVKAAYDGLSEEEREILKLLYMPGEKTVLGVAMALHMSKATVCRKRNAALAKVAVQVAGSHILMPVQK